MNGVGIRAVAVELPKGIRTNKYWENHYPEMVRAARQKKLQHEVWREPESDTGPGAFRSEMAHYLDDPFRGTVERRVLTPGENSLMLERSAALKALDAAQVAPRDIELMIVSSLMPDTLGAMNAAPLARDLGIGGVAWNLESACSGALIALQTAWGLLRAGQFRNALIVVSCSYSREAAPEDTVSWTVGDGAGALLLGPVEAGSGCLAAHSLNTSSTCGSLWMESSTRGHGKPWFKLVASPQAGKILEETQEGFLRKACQETLEQANLRVSDIDHFVFNTPLACYAKFCARVIGADPSRFINTYPKYANAGPAMLPLGLYHGTQERPIRRGDLVLLYTVGSVSSAGAMVLRWGDMILGAPPQPPSEVCD